MIAKETVTWRDIGFRERFTVLPCATIDGAPNTLADLRIMSSSVVTSYHVGEVQATGATLASSATYPDLDDEWIVTGQDAGNYRTQLYIPAPLVAAAIADTVNYVAASSEWIAIEAALPALAVPYTGDSIQEIVAATMARAAGQTFQTYLNIDLGTSWARRTLQWCDITGHQRLTHLIGLTDSLGDDFDTVMDAFQAVSAAVVTHFWEGEMSVFADDPVADLYASVRDAAVFTFADEHGNLTEIVLPAPARVIFLDDGKTVNVAQANVATFIADALTELLVPVSELAPVVCLGGRLEKQSVY